MPRSKAEEYEAYFGLILFFYETGNYLKKRRQMADQIFLHCGNHHSESEPNAWLIKGKSWRKPMVIRGQQLLIRSMVDNYNHHSGGKRIVTTWHANTKPKQEHMRHRTKLIFERSQAIKSV